MSSTSKPQQPSRLTAQICTVNDLVTGQYIVQDGWKPNFVKTTSQRQLAKVNIIGFITQKPTPFQFTIDDSTASIEVIDFNNNKKTAFLKVGDPVMIIARPRLSEEKLFLALEIVSSRQLKKEPSWISYRKHQLEKILDLSNEIIYEEADQDDDQEDVVKENEEGVSSQDILDFIKNKDQGEGCPIQDIIAFFGDSAESIILSLTSLGEIYEARSGIVKLLE